MNSYLPFRIKLFSLPLCLFLLVGWASSAFAQGPGDNVNDFLDLAASEIRERTREIVSGSMNLTADEGKAFWPLYRKYEYESILITDEMIALIKDYEASLSTLDDAKAKELADRLFTLDEKVVQLNIKYFEEFSAVLPAKRVLQFFQLARRIDTLVDLRIASIVPMIGEDW
jgi:hypothetical protein